MSQAAARLRELQVAVMMLTRLPAGRIAGQAPSLRDARWAFPLVGLPVAVLCWAGFAGAIGLGLAPLVAASLSLLVLALVTGGLHFDGLADFADGIGGGRDKAHCLEIMRDSRIGSYGVLALILGCGLWVTALADLAMHARIWHFLALAGVSRALMVFAQDMLPPARTDGLGQMAAGRHRYAQLVSAAVCVAVILGFGWAGLGMVVVMAVVALVMGAWARRRIGGQTGDVLGTIQLMSEIAGWVFLSAHLV